MNKPMTIQQQIDKVENDYSQWRSDVAAGGYAGCKDDPAVHARFKARLNELREQLKKG